MSKKKIGTVTHFYPKISVGIVKLEKGLKVGDNVSFEGSSTDFAQEVTSLQFDHQNLEKGKKGQEVGMKVTEEVREGDKVFLA